MKGNIANNFDARLGLTYQDKQKLPLTTKILLTYRHTQFATDIIVYIYNMIISFSIELHLIFLLIFFTDLLTRLLQEENL